MNKQPLHISLDKAYEVRHWARELDWSETDLYQAVRKVGKGLIALREQRRLSGPSVRVIDAAQAFAGSEPARLLYLVH